MNDRDFTRNRGLPLPHLTMCLLNLRKGSYRDELDRFEEVLTDRPVASGVTASAFCQARKKFNPSAFLTLNRQLLNQVHRHYPVKRWHDFRLLAVDGSNLRLPDSPDIRATFGPPPNGSAVPKARLSQLYDVLNHWVVDLDVEPMTVGERVLAGEYLVQTRPDDLLLYDRGYPAFWFLAAHQQEQRHYCMRLSTTFSNQVQAFANSCDKSARILMTPNESAKAQCQQFGLPVDPIPMRLVKVPLETGETEILATSLIDESRYFTPWFKRLYHFRWNIEESFKTEKCRLELENFTGLSSLSVLQDIYAKIFVMNLSRALAWVAQCVADRLYRHRKHSYRINFAHALSVMKDQIVRLLLGIGPPSLLPDIVWSMARSVEAVRPDRTYPRNMSTNKTQGFFQAYKRTR